MTPDLSIVIVTHARETRLAFALDAIAAQTLPKHRFEVIVVRRADARGPFATAPAGLTVRFEVARVPTRPGQRNHGWRAARAPVVAFTDDDCRPHPGWLEALLAPARDGSAFVQGRTEPDPDEAHLLVGLARSIRVVGPSPWFETCNIAYPRDLLEQLGGFDEEFVESGEDTDLGLRAVGLGARAVYADAALVHHAVVAQPLATAVRSALVRWQSTPLIFKRHPDQRRYLFARVFFNRTHATVLGLAGAAVFVRRRRGAAVALAIPYVVDAFDSRNLGPRGLLRQSIHLPARAIRDLAHVAGLVRGAVRHRSPMA